METEIKQSKKSKILNVILILIIAFLINITWSALVSIVYTVVLMAREGIADPQALLGTMFNSILTLTLSSIYNIPAIAMVFVFWRYVDRRRIEELGFGITGKTGIQLLYGILAAVLAVLLIIVFGAALGIISYQGYGTDLYKGSQLVSSSLLGVITFIMVGFGEETVYRAYVQKHIVEMTGNRYGLLISAFIFMLVHTLTYARLLDFIDVFLAGIILGYAYILTKSIYLPAAFHFMWDFLQVNIFRLQDYQYYTGPVVFLFENTGDMMIGNFNLGNKLELIFIAVEIIILILMHAFRKKLARLAA
ncbi:MAG: hypothetical protein K0R84_1284 [Clostridia bacterium]|nr:hypothetical protein [Clostridia bacterium]